MPITIAANPPVSVGSYAKQFPKAVAVALTRTAWDVQKALVGGMGEAFDRPTPFTMRAFRVEMAKAGDLQATVWAAPQQAKYLFWQIEGGERSEKGFERRMNLFGGEVALPGSGVALNQYGNMSMAFIKRATAGGNSFFTGRPKNRPDAPEGVWMRTAGGQLRMAMAFADHASYDKRLDMEGIAQRTVQARFKSQLLKAMEQFSK